ncbi:MAG: hypothetical protein HKN08_11365, partial [Gammaproteobacteria bacterium]|nr:hypothetical protein [Gammaproteobacteria bacterium]
MRKAFKAISLFLMLLLLSGYYLVSTQGGLGILLGLVNRGEITVTAEVRTGSLMSGFELENVKLSVEAGDISINHFQLEWDLLDFLFSEKRIQSLILEDVIYLANIQEQPPEQTPLELNLPDIFFDSFIISNLQFQNAEDGGLFQLEHLQTSFQVVENVFSISDLLVRRQNLELNSNGSVLLQLPYTINLSTDVIYTTGAGRQLTGKVFIGGELNQIQTTIDIPHGNATISITDIATAPVWEANLSLSEFRPDEIDITLPEVGINLDLSIEGTATTAIGNSFINLDYPDETVPDGDPGENEETAGIPDEFQLGFDTRLDTDSQVITFNDLSISAGDIQLNSSGVYDFLQNQFNITINWSDWILNISDDLPPVAATGSIILDGELDSYNIRSSMSIS